MEDQNLNIIQLVFGTALLSILFTTFVVFVANHFQKKEFLFNKKFDDLKLSYDNNLLKSELEIQEQAFLQVSREIHDNLALDLTVSKLYLNTLNYPGRESNKEKIEASVQLLGNVIQKMRDISKSLNSDLIKENGLIYSIETEISIIRKIGTIFIDYTLTGDPVDIEPDRTLFTFRVIQETLNNILKHSKATEINLALIYKMNELEIIVKDNGIGFNTKAITTRRKDNSGIKNIYHRTKILEGNCEIISSPGNGTKVILNIPFLNSNTINHEHYHDHNNESSLSR